MFPMDCISPTVARPVSRVRRPRLPVTSCSFTAPKVHSGSWHRQAREFDVKGRSSRMKGEPIVSAVLELVGVETFTFSGN